MDKRVIFESEMRKMGMYEMGGASMARCDETGGYKDPDTNAMWAGFLIGLGMQRTVTIPHEYKRGVVGVRRLLKALNDAGVSYERD